MHDKASYDIFCVIYVYIQKKKKKKKKKYSLLTSTNCPV